MPLKHLESGNLDSETGVLMCHGFGAGMGDLVDLGQYLDPERRFAWYFPQAPYSLPFPGAAWFPESKEDMNRALQGSYFQDLALMDDIGRSKSLDLLEEFCGRHPHRRWILGGFSQGSMLALHLAARMSVRVSGLILFSSAPFALSGLEAALAKNFPDGPPGFPCFQSHGIQDAILTISQARALKTFLQARGFSLEYLEFRGSHEIPVEVLLACKAFLSAI